MARVAFVLACVATLVTPASTHARQVFPGDMFPRSVSYDLAAATLYPADLPFDGLVLVAGQYVGIDQQAHEAAELWGVNVPVARGQLEEAGYIGQYNSFLATVNAADPELYSLGILSVVAEYEDEDGAVLGYEQLLDEAEASAEEQDAPEVGDRSRLMRTEGSDLRTGPWVRLEYQLQIGSLVAEVEVNWFEDPSEEISTDGMVEIAETFSDRIETVVDGGAPDLFSMMLRVQGTDDVAFQGHDEQYMLLDEEFQYFIGDTEEVAGPIRDFWADAGVENAYRSASFLVPSTAGPDAIGTSYINRIYDLGSERRAKQFVEEATQMFIETGAPDGYTDIELLDDLPHMGTEVTGVSYSFPISDGIESTGYRIWARSGNYVFSMESDALDGVDVEILTELAEEQIDCLESERFCRPIDVPEGLVN